MGMEHRDSSRGDQMEGRDSTQARRSARVSHQLYRDAGRRATTRWPLLDPSRLEASVHARRLALAGRHADADTRAWPRARRTGRSGWETRRPGGSAGASWRRAGRRPARDPRGWLRQPRAAGGRASAATTAHSDSGKDVSAASVSLGLPASEYEGGVISLRPENVASEDEPACEGGGVTGPRLRFGPASFARAAGTRSRRCLPCEAS